MAHLPIKSFVAVMLALLISAGQVCACAAGIDVTNAAEPEMEQAAHHGDSHNSMHDHDAKGQDDHQHDAPGHDCSHCVQPPYLKGAIIAELSASLAAPLSVQMAIAPDAFLPFSNIKTLRTLNFFAFHDPPIPTPVSLKIRLLI